MTHHKRKRNKEHAKAKALKKEQAKINVKIEAQKKELAQQAKKEK